MREYFDGLDPGSLTNCPRCGLITEKEEGGCNHMICTKCKYEFCWICGSKYNVEHFAPGNVFGCQGLQHADPSSMTRTILTMLWQIFLIPFTLLFYPVFVLYAAFFNPFYMPQRWRFLCFCHNNCLLLFCFWPIILILGLILGVLNLAVFLVPALVFKLWKLLKMVTWWRCMCCLNRHIK